MTTTDSLPGYGTQAVEAWIEHNVAGLQPPLTWTWIEGGHSNLTYKLEDGRGNIAIIRRPPLGKLLPKAHDMAREWALISALGPTAVPVPEALGFCEDVEVTGAHFYVMEFVEGHVLYGANDTERWLPEASRMKFASRFIEVLAELHALDPDAVGLGDLGKKENYVGRQLKTWYRSWNASIEGAEFDDPRAHTLQEYFLANMPEQGPAKVVHGDYSVHNILTTPEGGIAAVLDWEISTLGDPLADLAYALNQWPDESVPVSPRGAPATSVPGFPTRFEMARWYEERTGRDLSLLDYYAGFNRWKTAAITHGVYARYMEGQKSTEGVDLEGLRKSVEYALTLAEQAVARLESK
ncbi:MAG: phosphotransferase family protein [Chloroflexi bacterium]|nr:phosphotransferase family protein [Chloroflexota bacterium]